MIKNKKGDNQKPDAVKDKGKTPFSVNGSQLAVGNTKIRTQIASSIQMVLKTVPLDFTHTLAYLFIYLDGAVGNTYIL